MSDPERLSVASDSDLERLLLKSGRTPAPEGSRHRALVAATAVLGATGLAAGGAAAGSAAGGAAAKAGSVLSLKWIAFFGIAGIGAMTAAVVMNDRPLTSEASHRTERPLGAVATAARPSFVSHAPLAANPPPAATVDDPAPALPPTPAPLPSAARLPAVPAQPTASVESSVHAELGTLEQARAALAGGQPARALAILDAYSASYPRGSMGPEATVLRVEALVRAGDRPAAGRVGDAFLASTPQSPYAARIRSLLGTSNP